VQHIINSQFKSYKNFNIQKSFIRSVACYNKNMNSWLKQFHYKELFLVGFYLSFIIITTIAAIVDYLVENPLHAKLDLLFVSFSIFFFLYFLKSKNHKIAARGILWIATTLVFIFVVNSQFDMSIIFTLLLPIVAFILMPPREIIFNMTLYYLILFALLIFGYLHYEHNQILHNVKTMSAYFIASLFVIAFGLFYNYAIEESHRQLEKANRQKEILLKEIHHRIKNNLNIISSILGLQKLESNHPDIDRIIEQNRSRIESISMAHETLYRSDDLEHIDFATYIKNLATQLFITSDKKDTIALHVKANAIIFPLDHMVKLGIILNEFLTNSIKYACSDAITIHLSQDSEHYVLEYFDNEHPHHDLALPETETLGLSLVKMTVEQMNGTLSTHANNPFRYSIRFNV
jgi:two-component sensor histidine kinase